MIIIINNQHILNLNLILATFGFNMFVTII
jgi:hypothetical protein